MVGGRVESLYSMSPSLHNLPLDFYIVGCSWTHVKYVLKWRVMTINVSVFISMFPLPKHTVNESICVNLVPPFSICFPSVSVEHSWTSWWRAVSGIQRTESSPPPHHPMSFAIWIGSLKVSPLPGGLVHVLHFHWSKGKICTSAPTANVPLSTPAPSFNLLCLACLLSCTIKPFPKQ